MNIPTLEEVVRMKHLVSLSIRALINNDRNIFAERLQNNGTWYRRKLHEITLCHRLAVYLENNLGGSFNGEYNVDLEYNKYYGDVKRYHTESGPKEARPDIVIHTRTRVDVEAHQNLLLVEAKMAVVPLSDVKKVIGFMKDPKYFYLFGLTISFWSDLNAVRATLYYCDLDTGELKQDEIPESI